MMIYGHKIVLTLILLMLTAVLPVGCANSAATLPTRAPTTVALTAAAPTAASITAAASQNLNDAHVRVLGLWSDEEILEKLLALNLERSRSEASV